MSEDRSALLTALVTEHSVQQCIAKSTIGEASGRASLYMTSFSSMLIVLGFLSRAAGFGEVRLHPLRQQVSMNSDG